MATDKQLLEQLWQRFDDNTETPEARKEVGRLILEIDPPTPLERNRWAGSDPTADWTLEKAALTFRTFDRILAS